MSLVIVTSILNVDIVYLYALELKFKVSGRIRAIFYTVFLEQSVSKSCNLNTASLEMVSLVERRRVETFSKSCMRILVKSERSSNTSLFYPGN